MDLAKDMGWQSLNNGELLDRAEAHGYDLLLTADQSIRHQQNLQRRNIAIAVLLSNSWPNVQLKTSDIQEALRNLEPGTYLEIPI